MIKATATDVRNNLGRYIEKARRNPVMLQRNGQDVVVLLDAEEYKRLVSAAESAGPRPLKRPRTFGFAKHLIRGSFDVDDDSHLADFAEYME